MRLNIAIPEEHVKKPILDAGLETTTRINEELLAQGRIPTFTEGGHGVRWKPEPPGQGEHFDHAAKVLSRGWGDCDDLAPWHAASLRATGVDRGAVAEVKRSGPTRWHAIVRRSDGTIEDPSIAAGMRTPAGGLKGAVVPVMAQLSGVDGAGALVELPQLAVRPLFSESGEISGWEARADMPWHHRPSDYNEDAALTVLRRSGIPEQSVVGALRNAAWVAELSGLVHPSVIDRAHALADGFDGADWEDLAHEYGEDEADAVSHVVGDIFGDIASVVSKVVSFVPGIGPIASLAIDLGKQGIEAVQKAAQSNNPPPPDVLREAEKYAKHRAKGGPKAKKVKLHPAPKGAVSLKYPDMRVQKGDFAFSFGA